MHDKCHTHPARKALAAAGSPGHLDGGKFTQAFIGRVDPAR